MNGKHLGKIKEVDVITEYGHVYVLFEFAGEDFGVFNHYPLQPSDKATDLNKWDICKLAPLMEAAKVDKLSKMKDKPVEVVFEGNVLQSWRILTEVL